MRRRFRSRPDSDRVDEYHDYDDGGLDTVGLASGALGRRSVLGDDPESEVGPYGDYPGEYATGDHQPVAEPAVSGPGLIGRRLRRNRGPEESDDVAATGERPVVSADAFSDGMERYRTEASREQRSAWAYLVVLAAMFVVLTGFGWACTDDNVSDVAVDSAAGGGPANEAVNLVVRVEGDTVGLEGAVPDEGARAQVVEAAVATYGEAGVSDGLEIDDAVSFDGGTLRLVGSAVTGDERPAQLQARLIEQLGLEDRGNEVQEVDQVLRAVVATVDVTDDVVTAAGELPDEVSVADLTELLGQVFGGEVDAAGLVVGPTTWTEGTITLSGTISGVDPRVAAFSTATTETLGTLVTVDTSSLAVTDDPTVVGDVQALIAEAVESDPIQFAPNSPEIATESEPVLARVAELLNQVPSTSLEIVGHTDSVGDEAENQALSESRAAAVVDRLVELGVSEDRMTSRGEGESDPVADNTTEEGKAANRRIEFVLAGAAVDG